jgi:hypothetical protein
METEDVVQEEVMCLEAEVKAAAEHWARLRARLGQQPDDAS